MNQANERDRIVRMAIKGRRACASVVFSLVVIVQGCAGLSSPHDLIDRNDHAGLVKYYTEEAKKFRQYADTWQLIAEFYEKQSKATAETARHAAHCRAIAQNTFKAAEEAEALANEHRRQLEQTPK